MADQVLDPEKAMKRDLEKKKLVATKTIEIIRTAFIKEFVRDFGKPPDLTNPMINTFYNAWLSAQGKREWLTPEEKKEIKQRQIQNEKRRKTMLFNNEKRRSMR